MTSGRGGRRRGWPGRTGHRLPPRAAGPRTSRSSKPADAPAAAWRGRWDSLRLFTPVATTACPGLPFPGDPDTLPGPRRRRRLPHRLRRALRAARRAREPGRGRAARRRRLPGRARRPHLRGRPGGDRDRPFQIRGRPRSPSGLAAGRRAAPQQRVPRPGELPAGPVLVVGGGNTGFQIAEELVADARGASVDRRAADAAAAADLRPRPVPLSRGDRPDGQDRRLAARSADAGARDADRLQPARRARRHGIRLRDAHRRLRHRGDASTTAAGLDARAR